MRRVWCGVYGRGEAPVERRKGRETHHTTRDHCTRLPSNRSLASLTLIHSLSLRRAAVTSERSERVEAIAGSRRE